MPSTAVSVGVLQDGDSNFISNDSTSQEPNIDENTTQTTATTSTDDGEVGTPLASDSESNMEAPANTKIANAIASSGVTGAAIVATLMPSATANNTNSTTANGGNNSSNSLNPINNASPAVGNGNGALTMAPIVADEGSDEEDDEEDDDDEDEVEDEDSNNSTVLTPLVAANKAASAEAVAAADSTLVGQKRALQQCGSDGGGIIEECNAQPELKKIRSD